MGATKERSKCLVRMDSKMDLPPPIFLPISETFQMGRFVPKLLLWCYHQTQRMYENAIFMLITTY